MEVARRWAVALSAIAACAALMLVLVLGAPPLQAQEAITKGEITKLDRAAGRVTIKHGEIKNLDMPPMTMIFQVKDVKLLDGVGVGDRVRFAAERIDGRYTVTILRKAP